MLQLGHHRGPVYKHPPIKLNFFELLRASLGDAQFSDVWLVPEAPHFHQKALGLDRMTDIKPPQAGASPVFGPHVGTKMIERPPKTWMDSSAG